MMKKLCFLILWILAFTWGVPISAEETKSTEGVGVLQYLPGQQYELVTPAQPTQTGDKIEVLEIFWYGCPHCNEFEPILNKWVASKPADVAFVRMPAIFRDNWKTHAKAFYTAEELKVTDKIHSDFFKALHKDGRKLDDEASLAEFFAEHGVNKEEFSKVFNSFTVDSKVKQAVLMVRQYGIGGVPAVIVNGKYRTSASEAGSYENLLKVVDFLADKERKEMAKPAK